MQTADAAEENIRRIAGLFPGCVTETKDPDGTLRHAIDFDKLRAELGEEQILPEGSERYEFTWPGKRQAAAFAYRPIRAALRPCPEESVDFDTTKNLYIEGDYLAASGQFDDQGQRLETNTETNGRYHTDWLNMIYPRLRLARELLTDDGVIFISIDDHEVENLKKVCNEVFGEGNFVAILVWERAFSPKNDAKYISNSHDYIVMYAKQLDSFTIGRLGRTEEANARYSNPDNDPRGVWQSDNLTVKTYSKSGDYPITTPSGRVVETPG